MSTPTHAGFWKVFVRNAGNLFIQPRASLRAVLDDPRRVGLGFMGILTLTAVYTVALSVGIINQQHPAESSLVLRIPAQEYYLYERVFLLPVAVVGVILSAGTIRLIAYALGGRGCFEGDFAVVGFILIITAFVKGLPDLAAYLAAYLFRPPGTQPIANIILGTLWPWLLTILAVREAEKLGWVPSIAVGTAGFLAHLVPSAIAIR